MWGGDDPDPRKPMLWSDLEYEREAAHPMGLPRPSDLVEPDLKLFRTYQDLIALRKEHLRLFVDGDLRWLRVDNANRVLVYERGLGTQRAIVAFNASEDHQEVEVEAEDGTWRTAFSSARAARQGLDVTAGVLRAELAPLSARVWILD
jgi:cyclomaltodextrinase